MIIGRLKVIGQQIESCGFPLPLPPPILPLPTIWFEKFYEGV